MPNHYALFNLPKGRFRLLGSCLLVLIGFCNNSVYGQGNKINLPKRVDKLLTNHAIWANKYVPDSIKKEMAVLTVQHLGFDGNNHFGQLVVRKSVANEVCQIFEKLFLAKFPIESILPVSVFGWNDNQSMRANNTSGFNFRRIGYTTKLSEHALGLAIDINPLCNPMINKGVVQPINASYNTSTQGTITKGSEIVKVFKTFGWEWGGGWDRLKDYQHFQKRPSLITAPNPKK